MLHVSFDEDPVETEVKGKITINCIIRKLYRSIIDSIGDLGWIAQSRQGIFLFNRDLIPQGMHEQGRLSRGWELANYLYDFHRSMQDSWSSAGVLLWEKALYCFMILDFIQYTDSRVLGRAISPDTSCVVWLIVSFPYLFMWSFDHVLFPKNLEGFNILF